MGTTRRRKHRDDPDFAPRAGNGGPADDAQRCSEEVRARKSNATFAWGRCVTLANGQLGLITWDQLRAVGVPASTAHRWVSASRLHRLHPRVYVLGHLALAPMANELAAQLACGPGAVISHRSAAHLWGFIDDEPPLVDVTLAGRRCRPKKGIRVHSSAKLPERDVRPKGLVRLTYPARTVIDMAADLTLDELERLIAEARARKLLRDGELEAAVEQVGNGRGTAAVRAYLGREGGPVLTRSQRERLMRRLVREAGLAQPQSNVRVAGYEVDFLWAEQRVVVEVDSWQFHGHRAAFERDRRKSMRLTDSGYIVIRITARQLVDEPLAVIAHISRALERASFRNRAPH